MGLDFDRIKHRVEHGTGHQWTSYSDLFLVLSVTFLLLYMVANLRGGAAAVVAQEQLRVASIRMSELEKQVKAFEVLKDNYLEKGATQDEIAMYKELEDKLSLLEENAKEEYEDLQTKAREARLRFDGLNKYQALVKNIVNANLVASAKTKRQLNMLDYRDDRIEEKDDKIDELDQETQKQQRIISRNKAQIERIKDDLEKKEEDISNLKNVSAKERQAAQARLRKARQEAEAKIQALESQNQAATTQLAETERQLKKKSNEARYLASTLEKTKADFEAEIANTKAEHEARVAAEREQFESQIQKAKMSAAQKAKAARELEERLAASERDMNSKLKALENERAATQAKLGATEAQLADKTREAEKLVSDLQSKTGEYEKKIASIRGAYEAEANRERAKLQDQLKAAQMTAAEKAQAEKQLRDRLAKSEDEMNRKLSSLAGEVEGARQKLARAEQEYTQTVDQLQKSNQTLQRDLQASVNKLNAQKRLAQQIKANLRASGIDAEVDPKTGDVTISFGDEYFDTSSAVLKPGMKEIVRKTIPVYARSLFQNPEIAKKLDTVEIVGFASPTYQGRVVDPQSLEARDRAAVNYNMDLSYRRARSIFEFVTDTNKLSFDKQRELLPLVKVSGRSYLSADRRPSSEGRGSDQSYCAKFNCLKHQIVVIRFTLRE